MENQFGRISQLRLTTGVEKGKTVLRDLFFTAPYKVMTPFQKRDGGIQVMPLCASAGIMEGDCQKFSFLVKEGSNLEYLSQSFEKIHKMKEGCAKREAEITQEKNSIFFYHPQPVIPFRDSDFENHMEVHLEDETARFAMVEILSGGRKAHDEMFAYRRYLSKIQIYRKGQLIYRDYTRYEPDEMDMAGLGMYEGYTHMASIFLSTGPDKSWQEEIAHLLEETKECEGAVTRLVQGDFAVRILGTRAQVLEETAAQILESYKNYNKQT
ncbi:MAG: urease accessory protein UreD [Lachnospiraceae bacterium]|nr:urease accessory protein UreD [Robinsoniella sp.]MDY3767323.1 urease accessory protein UreD [Lachnospiraceae bacterium]